MMSDDSSWDVMPVASPALAERKQRNLIGGSLAHDPVGLAEPLYDACQRRTPRREPPLNEREPTL
jgi:hypothetical protein